MDIPSQEADGNNTPRNNSRPRASRKLHKKLKLFLIVYVDDFKLAGPKANLAAGWKLIRERIKMDEPTKADKFLGCQHTIT